MNTKRGDFIKKYLVLEIDNKYTKVLLLSKKRNRFYIEKDSTYKIGLTSLLLNQKELILKIKKEFNIDKTISGIYFYIQNEDIIIRNLENIKTKKQKEIIGLIKFEINQYMPIDLQNYHIKYKKVEDEMGQVLIQSILVPKNISDTCKDLSENLGINKKYLNLDFDILDKLIKRDLINNLDEEDTILIIENKKEDLIINKVFKKQIIESYRTDKNKDSKRSLKDLCENNKSYFYGLKDEYMKDIDINNLEIKNKLNIYPLEENNINVNEYISALGMII